MTTEQAPARRARWLQRAVILAIVLVAAYGLPALWPEVRTAVAGVAEIAPAVMLAALVLETASLACFSGLTVRSSAAPAGRGSARSCAST